MVLKHFQTNVHSTLVIICRDITRDTYFFVGDCRLRKIVVLSAKMNQWLNYCVEIMFCSYYYFYATVHSDDSWHRGQVWSKLTAVSQYTVIYDRASTNCMNAYSTFLWILWIFIADMSTLKFLWRFIKANSRAVSFLWPRSAGLNWTALYWEILCPPHLQTWGWGILETHLDTVHHNTTTNYSLSERTFEQLN